MDDSDPLSGAAPDGGEYPDPSRPHGVGSSVMDFDAILRVLPHRYPFLFVDTVIELEPGVRIVALKNVSGNEPFFAGHFTDHPTMPGLLIVEAMAQAGGILLLAGEERCKDKLVYFASLNGVRWHASVRPGDQLRLEITVGRRRGSLNRVQGRALVGSALICEAEMAAVVVER